MAEIPLDHPTGNSPPPHGNVVEILIIEGMVSEDQRKVPTPGASSSQPSQQERGMDMDEI
jgi:hypothetical protein